MTTRRDILATLPILAVSGLAGRLAPGAGPALAQEAPAGSPEALSRDLVVRRGVEAMIWGMPAVNRDLMYQAMLRETPGRANQMLYWSKLLDWKNQTLTPNTDVIYLTPYFDTREVGPVVLEIPPADDGVINGTIMDAWQMPLEDVGPAGVDGGKGGKYVILPPGYAETVPDGLHRAAVADLEGLCAAALDPQERQRGRPRQGGRVRQADQGLSAVAGGQPAARRFTWTRTASLYDATIPYDLRFYEVARPGGAGRALAAARPGDDRHAPDDRHREGQALRARCRDEAGAGRGRGAGACAARREVGGDLRARWVESSRWAFPASQAFVTAVQSRLRRSGRLSDRRSRRRLHLRLLHAQAAGRRPVLSDGHRRQGRHAV